METRRQGVVLHSLGSATNGCSYTGRPGGSRHQRQRPHAFVLDQRGCRGLNDKQQTAVRGVRRRPAVPDEHNRRRSRRADHAHPELAAAERTLAGTQPFEPFGSFESFKSTRVSRDGGCSSFPLPIAIPPGLLTQVVGTTRLATPTGLKYLRGET